MLRLLPKHFIFAESLAHEVMLEIVCLKYIQ